MNVAGLHLTSGLNSMVVHHYWYHLKRDCAVDFSCMRFSEVQTLQFV